MDTVSTALTLAGNSDLKDQIGKFQDTREKRYARYLSKVRRANSAAEEKALKKLTRANVGLAKAINNANNRTDKRTAKIEKAVSKINTKFDKKVAKMGSDVDAVKAMNIARSAAIQTKQDRGRDKGSLLNVIPNTINDYRKDKAKKATDMVTRARMNSELRNHLASNKVALAHLKRPFVNTTPDAMIKNHLTGYKVSNTANFSELAYEIFSDTVENEDFGIKEKVRRGAMAAAIALPLIANTMAEKERSSIINGMEQAPKTIKEYVVNQSKGKNYNKRYYAQKALSELHNDPKALTNKSLRRAAEDAREKYGMFVSKKEFKDATGVPYDEYRLGRLKGKFKK